MPQTPCSTARDQSIMHCKQQTPILLAVIKLHACSVIKRVSNLWCAVWRPRCFTNVTISCLQLPCAFERKGERYYKRKWRLDVGHPLWLFFDMNCMICFCSFWWFYWACFRQKGLMSYVGKADCLNTGAFMLLFRCSLSGSQPSGIESIPSLVRRFLLEIQHIAK